MAIIFLLEPGFCFSPLLLLLFFYFLLPPKLPHLRPPILTSVPPRRRRPGHTSTVLTTPSRCFKSIINSNLMLLPSPLHLLTDLQHLLVLRSPQPPQTASHFFLASTSEATQSHILLPFSTDLSNSHHPSQIRNISTQSIFFPSIQIHSRCSLFIFPHGRRCSPLSTRHPIQAGRSSRQAATPSPTQAPPFFRPSPTNLVRSLPRARPLPRQIRPSEPLPRSVDHAGPSHRSGHSAAVILYTVLLHGFLNQQINSLSHQCHLPSLQRLCSADSMVGHCFSFTPT